MHPWIICVWSIYQIYLIFERVSFCYSFCICMHLACASSDEDSRRWMVHFIRQSGMQLVWQVLRLLTQLLGRSTKRSKRWWDCILVAFLFLSLSYIFSVLILSTDHSLGPNLRFLGYISSLDYLVYYLNKHVISCICEVEALNFTYGSIYFKI